MNATNHSLRDGSDLKSVGSLPELARTYLDRGWAPIPVPHREKAPIFTGWQDLRLEEVQLRAHFNGQPINVGVLLGEPSGGLTDVDLDCPEAVRLAPAFLLPTASRFGRTSKRASHWLYVVTAPVSTERFADPAGTTLVELRSTGAQTVSPGSVPPSGEPIEWDEDGAQARCDGATLRTAAVDLAAACLLARHWPTAGRRHDAALAAAGLFVRHGLGEERAVRMIHHAALEGHDEQACARRRDVVSTVARLAAGEPVTGGPPLGELLAGDGGKVVTALFRWYGWARAAGEDPLTDVGNAARFVTEHDKAFRYCYAWAGWLHFDGRRWRRDVGDAAMRAAKLTARGWFAQAAQATDAARRKALAKWATYANSEPGLRRMLSLAQSDLAVSPDQLDADPWLLNCPNGTLELRSWHLRPHQREDFLTKMTAAPYDPDAAHPVWTRFLRDAIPDAGARDYAQRYAGYALTGSTREEVFVFVRGPAGGGKSTFV